MNTATHYANQFARIVVKKLPADLRKEVADLRDDTNNFKNGKAVEVVKESLDMMIEIVRDQYPDAWVKAAQKGKRMLEVRKDNAAKGKSLASKTGKKQSAEKSKSAPKAKSEAKPKPAPKKSSEKPKAEPKPKAEKPKSPMKGSSAKEKKPARLVAALSPLEKFLKGVLNLDGKRRNVVLVFERLYNPFLKWTKTLKENKWASLPHYPVNRDAYEYLNGVLNRVKEQEVHTFNLPNDLKDGLKKAVGTLKEAPLTALARTVAGWSGRDIPAKQIEALRDRAKKALDATSASDADHKALQHVYLYLKNDAKPGKQPVVNAALEGIFIVRKGGKKKSGKKPGKVIPVAKPSQKKAVSAKKKSQRGIGGLEQVTNPVALPVSKPAPTSPSSLPAIMSADQVARFQYDKLDLKGKYAKLLGPIARNAQVMIWGDRGQGKTTLMLQLAREFARQLGKVLYVTGEEYGGPTLTENLNRQGGPVARLDFAGSVDAIKPGYDFIILDSVQKLNLSPPQYNDLRKRFPKTVFLTVFRTTKENLYRGGSDWAFDVDVEIRVDDGVAYADKNRFGPLAEVSIF